jgi:hypothetical protein
MKRNRLQKFLSKIEALKAAGLSYANIALWLRLECRTHVHATTVFRAVKKMRSDNGQE